MIKNLLLGVVLLATLSAAAQTVIDVTGKGAEKLPVSVNVKGDPAFAASLKRNLELSGAFKVVSDGAVKVSGTVGTQVVVEGRGKTLTLASSAADAKAARMEARRLADKMSESYAGQAGFACDPITFVSRQGKDVSELCLCYPDGYDIVQLTSDGKSTVGPRWKDKDAIYFTGLRNAGPQIFEYNLKTKKITLKWSFKGLTTGATVSPDGQKVAIILSLHGNPELYIINIAAGTWTRLTKTPYASEGQPCWSPDGTKIVYVSDESRKPQLYVIDVATKQKTRLTQSGSQNLDPDWSLGNQIVYITKGRGGSQIAVIDMNDSLRTPMLVGEVGTWEHPSWARDNRHVVAGADKALFVVDTVSPSEGGDQPKRLFRNAGNWITPCWSK